MARSDVDLSGLPQIDQGGGFDLDNLFKLATLMESQADQRAKLGTPGTPGKPGVPAQVLPEASVMSRLFGGVDKVSSLPEDIPEGASFAPGTADLLTAGQPVFLKRGKPAVEPTPGTPGTNELAIKASIANLLDPESAQQQFTQRGFQGIKFSGAGKKTDLYFNPQTAQLSDTPVEGYWPLERDEAVKASAAFYRSKLEAGINVMPQINRRLSELNDLGFKKTDAQKAELSVLEDLFKQVMGVSALTKAKEGFIKKKRAEYAPAKQEALQIIESNRSSNKTEAEIREANQGILDTLRKDFGPDIYDFSTQEEKKLLGKRGFFGK